MRTTRPFGFISYNTSDFLKSVLTDFVSRGILGRFYCVYHSPTDNKPDIKPHFHCYVEPLKQIDTEVFKNSFVQQVSDGIFASIALKSRCSSKFLDFYLYSIHNQDYLTAKCLSREDVDIKPDCCIVSGDFSEDINLAFIFWIQKLLRPTFVSENLLNRAQALRTCMLFFEFPLLNSTPYNRPTNAYQMNYKHLRI